MDVTHSTQPTSLEEQKESGMPSNVTPETPMQVWQRTELSCGGV